MTPQPSLPEEIYARLRTTVAAQPYPLVFATVSGAHLYGFASPDSDFDLRGAHVLPLPEVVGLVPPEHDTVEVTSIDGGFELDLVSHDVHKFCSLLLKRNGYVLEQLLSPLVVHRTPALDELRALAPGCITKHHAHHYLGFFRTQWKLLQKEDPPRVKPILYAYRVLLTGIHLVRTGEVDANLPRLNDHFRLPYIPELIQRKVEGKEKSLLSGVDLAFHEAELLRLEQGLKDAFAASTLRDAPTAGKALNALLVRLRLGEGPWTST
jgi:predicted nucleotidyltransferase